MVTNTRLPTLLPYIEKGGARFCLNFALDKQDSPELRGAFHPFVVIDESDPLSRLLEANFLTDAGSEIKQAFMLVQKSHYHLQEDELRPLNNKDIDQYWQQAFTFYAKESQANPIHILADQVGDGGLLLPFQSLFYCKFRKIYFHPPCAKCGLPLQQCHDDEILLGLALQPFTTSLKRYLFCPSCFTSQGNSDFYVSTLEASDSALVKDQRGLIKEFDRLKENKALEDRFPCIGCPKHQECYGSDDLVLSNIIPFSFYPFYMLVFDAASVNALDFLALISGASFKDLEDHLVIKHAQGRLRCLRRMKADYPTPVHFFSEKESKRFLEILYLKLTFLGDLMTAIIPHLKNQFYPGPGISIDRFWIKLSGQTGLLPCFWNFKLMHAGVGRVEENMSARPETFPVSGLYYVGIIWFYTLLVNKTRDIREIYALINQMTEKIDVHADMSLSHLLSSEAAHAFSPENIYWTPDTASVHGVWDTMWEEALGLGWTLITAGLGHAPEWSNHGFQTDLESLRHNVRAGLFQEVPSAEESSINEASSLEVEDILKNDREIHEILLKIANKWRTSIDLSSHRSEDDRISKVQDEDEIGAETVLLRPEEIGMPAGQLPYKEPMAEPEEDDILTETVVIRPGEIGPPKEMAPAAAQAAENDMLDQTVILRPGKAGMPEEKATAGESVTVPGEADDIMDETVIIRPERTGKQEERALDRGAAATPQEEDILDETVIIRPGRTGHLNKKKSQSSMQEDIADPGISDEKLDDDFLEQTIIQKPDKNKK